MKVFLIAIPILFFSCVERRKVPVSTLCHEEKEGKLKSAMEKYYDENNQDSLASNSIGTPVKGSLINGSLIPAFGSNYKYFSEESYLKGRGFVNSNVKAILLAAFSELELSCPDQMFQIMESAHKDGGELWPHRTHQNGTSVDLMLPKMKDGQINYSIDDLGLSHYFLNTDAKGDYIDYPGVSVHYENTAKLILAIHHAALDKGWKIAKVIIRIELKNKLMSGDVGLELLKNNIYFAKHLSPKVNEFHDDHIHIDFEPK